MDGIADVIAALAASYLEQHASQTFNIHFWKKYQTGIPYFKCKDIYKTCTNRSQALKYTVDVVSRYFH